jgi:glycine/D-amino acid oxidase-like deaminating enzyme
MPKAVIVGAGINGLCTARALVARGWQVEVLEAGPAPNPAAASEDRHRLIRAQYTDPGYAARLPAAFAAWDALWRDLGRSHYIERGVLALSRAPGDWTDRSRAAAGGAGMEDLGPAEITRRWPMLAPEGLRFGLYAPRGGVLLADRILADLRRWLGERGVAIRTGTPVTAIDAAAGAVHGPAGGSAGDVVIVAAGVGVPRLLPGLAGDLVPHRVVLAWVEPPQRWRADWDAAPTWVDLGGAEDLWGMPPVAGMAMKLGAGHLTRPGDPETERRLAPGEAETVLAAYRGRFRDIDDFRVVEGLVNFYLMAPGERFVLRRDRRVVLLSADSGHGFKFGPLTGADVAEALDTGAFDAVARRLAGAAPVAEGFSPA